MRQLVGRSRPRQQLRGPLQLHHTNRASPRAHRPAQSCSSRRDNLASIQVGAAGTSAGGSRSAGQNLACPAQAGPEKQAGRRGQPLPGALQMMPGARARAGVTIGRH